MSFECERRRNFKGCIGKVKVLGDQLIVTERHSHEPNPGRNEMLKITAVVRDRAANTLETTQQIIGAKAAYRMGFIRFGTYRGFLKTVRFFSV